MTLGVLGSMVWDRIDHPAGERVEGWGGISYSLAAAAAALPDGWRIRPIVKLGADLADSGRAFLHQLPGVAPDEGLATTPVPNNRVHLRYHDHHDRHECLTGGVPAWTWDELEPRLRGLDALYVNLISGLELGLETARRLRSAVPGPVYADIHSLLLAVAEGGHREPRRLEDADAWVRCFDVVQVNEAELGLLAGDEPPGDFIHRVLAGGVGALLVTRGRDGASWWAWGEGPRPWDAADAGATRPSEAAAKRTPERRIVNGHAALHGGGAAGDPTGCGDVWGATCFLELVRGAAVADAVRAANHAAALNVTHQGAEGLYQHLEERL